jgi:hypothetical protein
VSLQDEIVGRCDALIEKGEQVLATHRPNSPNVIGFPTLDSGAFAEWQTQTLSFLRNTLGADHIYTTTFAEDVDQGFTSSVKQGQGILRAVREDVSSGYLRTIQALVASEVFAGFMEMAEHLLDAGYKDPAASLVGAVLEDGLRRIASANGVTVKSKDDLGSLAARIATAGVYNRLVQKKLAVWTDIRNNADHGKFNEYTSDDVKAMIAGITDFLGAHLS